MITVHKFYADWCAPCQAMTKVLEPIKEEYADSVIFSDVNIDDNPQERAKFGIRSIPAFVAVDAEGKEIGRKIGSGTATEMREFLNEYRRV